MHQLETISALVAERRRERETAAARMRLAEHPPARRRAAGALRRLADRIDSPRVSTPRAGLEAGRGA